MIKIMKFQIYILLVLLLISCKKDNSGTFPYVYVYLNLGINELHGLGVGGLATITQDPADINAAYVSYPNSKYPKQHIPYRVNGHGLLLYCDDIDSYIAYDLSCTYDYCAIDVKDYLWLPKCPCCKSVFILEDEALPSTGSKATTALKHYQTTYNPNSLILTITN